MVLRGLVLGGGAGVGEARQPGCSLLMPWAASTQGGGKRSGNIRLPSHCRLASEGTDGLPLDFIHSMAMGGRKLGTIG